MKKRAVIILSPTGRYVSGGLSADEAWRAFGGWIRSARKVRDIYKPKGYRCITVWWEEK